MATYLIRIETTGHEIRFGHRDPTMPVHDAAEWGDIIILAVLFTAVKDAAKEIGSAADGKVVIDVTILWIRKWNWQSVFSTFAAEESQKLLPKAKVVKAFNTVFAQNQSTGRLGREQLTAFIAGDDMSSKQVVMLLAKDLGFDPVDTVPLRISR